MSRRVGTTETVGLVLRRHDFSETSQTARLFSRDLGRLSVLAKGIRRGGPELRGPMDLLDLAEIEVRLRRDTDLHLLVRYVPVWGFPGLRRRLDRLGAALYVSEILREGTRDLDPEPGLFGAAVSALHLLEEARGPEVALVVSWFELRFLDLCGFEPDWSTCVRCEKTAPEGRPVRVSVTRGGLICRSCLALREEPTFLLARDARSVLLRLRAAAAAEVADAGANGKGAVASLRVLLPGILEQTLERELCAKDFVEA